MTPCDRGLTGSGAQRNVSCAFPLVWKSVSGGQDGHHSQAAGLSGGEPTGTSRELGVSDGNAEEEEQRGVFVLSLCSAHTQGPPCQSRSMAFIPSGLWALGPYTPTFRSSGVGTRS